MSCLRAIFRFICLLDGGGERVTWHMWEPLPAHLEEGREAYDCPNVKAKDGEGIRCDGWHLVPVGWNNRSDSRAGDRRSETRGYNTRGREWVSRWAMRDNTIVDGTRPANVPADGFYQKYKIPMFILFSAIAIAILSTSVWCCCFLLPRKKKSNELESQFHLAHLTGHGGVRREHTHLPYPHSLHYHPHGGRTGTSTKDRYSGRDRGGRDMIRTTSGWWRHAGPDRRSLYRNRLQRHTRVGRRVPPTTGTPLDSAYSLAYMQEETRQQEPQQHREGRQQEEYEMEAAHKGQAREATPPPPYKAKRSADDMADRPPGCLCGHV
ncbi:hypothetical protein QBC32DRAFT_212802 [Pseudoneurospora amorphoporcata]|uniref:Uncharacterized protein n=1 Tax=Pseudoneurospora amorphoporcata TaxID=241081 RepID=A0AAN6NUW1_9PEZI|nr:hypothetical protein QBC32DRAFT_212802 [Pseudoneurospora amorphoporcata]